MSRISIGALLFVSSMFTGCGDTGDCPVVVPADSGVPPHDASCPATPGGDSDGGPLPDGGPLEEPLPNRMIWSVLLLPDGSVDLDDGDVMTFSFFRTASGYDVRTCATSLEANGGAAARYEIDCTGIDEAQGTATVEDRTLTVTFSDASGEGTMTVMVDAAARTLSGSYAFPGVSGAVLESRRNF